ncbi:MAG: glycerophosphodiester phosphodiesterase family protein [Aeromicrobium sp.]
MSRLTYLGASGPVAIAHRGGAATASNGKIENSLEAFQDAVGRGFLFIETDVRCSADGTVWAIHDETLTRLTGSPSVTAELNDEQLSRERMDGRVGFVQLAEVLTALPDVRLNIDVKAQDAIGPTCDLIEAMGAVNRVCLSSFSHVRLRQIRRLLPSVTTGASRREVGLVKLFPAWLLAALHLPAADCLQVPVAAGRLTITTRRFIARAHRLGLQVHVWTVDDADEMHRLLDLGVDGLMTDRTDVLKDVLLARGTWKEPT